MSDSMSLPPTWASTKLGDVCTHPQYGFTTKATDHGTLKFLRTTDITSGTIDWNTVPYCRDEPDSLEQYLLEDGDVVISRAGSVGFSYLLKNPKRSVFASYLIRFRPLTDRQFFAYFLQSPFYWHEIAESKVGIAVGNVNASKLREIPFPLPPLAEQRRIVAKVEELFSELDEGVANLKKARAQLAVYRQALLKHAFEGHLTADWRTHHAPELESADQLLARIRAEMPKDSTNSAPDISSSSRGWLELSLSDITKESLIGLVRASDLQNQEGRGFCYIKMDRVDMSGHVDIEPKVFVDCSKAEVERFALRKGDILFNTRNSVELVGKTGLVRKPPSGPTVFNNNLMRIRLVSPVLPSFLNYQMCAPDFRNSMEKVKKATTSVAAVYGKDLWPLRIAIPSTREQQRIVDELDSHLDAVESLEADIDLNLQKAEALRQSILKKAFAGELVPQDPADEPAAALLARIRAEREAMGAIPKSKKTRPKKA
ncbi:MAG: hypothetical protein RL088_1661 [Verrucomicrobiota bacterium]